MESACRIIKLVTIGCCFLLLLAFNGSFCSGSVVWSDDFNDGNFTGWTVDHGSFSATNHLLEVTGSEWAVIGHPSTVVSGTWSFDVRINSSLDLHYDVIEIYLVADELLSQTDWTDVPMSNGYVINYDPVTWIMFSDEPGPPAIDIHRFTDADVNAYDIVHFAFNEISEWVHFDITRDISGTFSLYMNGTLYYQFTDSTHTTTAYFGLASFPGHAFDNIVVDNTPLSTPINPFIIGAVIALVIIVIVIIMIVMLRRRAR